MQRLTAAASLLIGLALPSVANGQQGIADPAARFAMGPETVAVLIKTCNNLKLPSKHIRLLPKVCPRAIFNLGKFDKQVIEDVEAMREKLRKGGLCAESDIKIEWCESPVEQFLAAWLNLSGKAYEHGYTVPQDYEEAANFYWLASVLGEAHSLYRLAVFYYAGRVFPQSYTDAAALAREAAEQGFSHAQELLGLMYWNGEGVPQDYVRAHMWFNLAASNFAASKDRDDAVRARDSLAERMTPDQIAEAQRLAREWKPK